MGEKKYLLIIVIIILLIVGKMCKGDLFKSTMQKEEQEVNKDESLTNNTREETSQEEVINTQDDNETAVITNETAVSEKKAYMEMYPDMYVNKKVEIPLAKLDENILDFRKYLFQYPVNNNVQNDKRVAYLTFDDGPSDNTRKVLDILEKYNIKATFFMIAETITPERYDLVKEMMAEGHVVGIHTYSHNYRQIYASVEAYLNDFYLAYTRMYEVTGQQPTVFRFPGGSSNCFMKGIKKEVIAEMQRRGFTYYDWQVSAEDAVGNPTRRSIMRNVAKDFKRFRKPIILLHDSSINSLMVQSLEDIIKLIKGEGYTFDTVDKR